MRIKKIFLILICMLFLIGCTNINNLSYDDAVNTISNKSKVANTHKKGYKYYVPRGLKIIDSGTNYAIIDSSDTTYYLYFDLISYSKKSDISKNIDLTASYSRVINYDNKKGYVNIKLWENNQYFIEIMYNYAKIEVMVDKDLVNKSILNSINILKSVKYNDLVIENLLNEDDSDYVEEIFDLFSKVKKNSNNLNYVETDTEEKEEKFPIKDTDYVD